MAFWSRTILVLVIFSMFMLSLIQPTRTQAVSLISGPVNTTLVVGQNLTLSCLFAEPLDGNFNIFWRRSNEHDEDLGRCQMSYRCHNFSNPRISLDEFNRTHFELLVRDVSLEDSGHYECGLENRSSKLKYNRLQVATVSVVQENWIENPSCSIEIPESAVSGRQLDMSMTFTQLTCTWPRDYSSALGHIVVPYMSRVLTTTSSGEVNYIAMVFSVSTANRILSSEGESECLMIMPGLHSQRSCSFSRQLSPPVVRIAEDATAEFMCNSTDPDSTKWFAIDNDTVIGHERMAELFSMAGERIIMSNVSISYNGLSVICTTMDKTGKRILSGSGKLVVIRQNTPAPEITNDHLAGATSLSPIQNGKERLPSSYPYATLDAHQQDRRGTTNKKLTTAPSAKRYASLIPINSNSEIKFTSFPSWIKYLVYYCSIASSLALAIAVLTVAYFCVKCHRTKATAQEDMEQPPQVAKVVAIPSHTSADYATIDSSELKLKRQKFDDIDGMVPRERKESFRYFQPNKVAAMTTGTLEVRMTPDGYATPSIPKPRTQSEYRPSDCDDPTYFDTSNRRHLWRNMSLQEPTQYKVDITGSRFHKIGDIDEESTVDSRTRVANNKGQEEVFYFPLDKIDTGDEQPREVDNKTMKSSMSEETTLGRNEHPYFTLEQSSQDEDLSAKRENNNCETLSKLTNNESTCDLSADSDYDNFRAKRIPYLRENSMTDHYEKLKCNSKG